MKKMLILVAIIAVSLMLTSGAALAVSGVCSNCHTMHNSQNGVAVTATGPYAKLLLGDCLGCHAQNIAGRFDANGIPQVNPTGGSTLAGGAFANAGADNIQHNIVALAGADATLTVPPGDNNASGVTNNNLSCAGTYGCHGDRTTAAELNSLNGAHHNNTNGAITAGAATPGASYRFLQGVFGNEDTDWQATVSAADHNEYYGINGAGAGASATAPAGNTISGFCNECHGNFHGAGASSSTQNASSEWIRHPTDHMIPNSGEYTMAFGGAAGAYVPAVPVARNDVSGVSATVTRGTTDALVMCLSCHKAHGSTYADILRWDYTTMVVGSTTAAEPGCFRCHTQKDGL